MPEIGRPVHFIYFFQVSKWQLLHHYFFSKMSFSALNRRCGRTGLKNLTFFGFLMACFHRVMSNIICAYECPYMTKHGENSLLENCFFFIFSSQYWNTAVFAAKKSFLPKP
ncbi:MAG: hypothetical protein OCU18_08945 [Candidatus Syntrophoarchaeum sp.]|nr:hypothetical protein [Candidatus Syntrophoarchaeum sp.]